MILARSSRCGSKSSFGVALVTVLALLASCGGTSDQAIPASAGEAPAEAPLTALSADADGATVYQARCASCHGEDLRGTDKGPSQLSIVYEPNHHGDASFRSAVRLGVQQHHWDFGDMPAVADITDEQIELVIAYIRSQQEALGFE